LFFAVGGDWSVSCPPHGAPDASARPKTSGSASAPVNQSLGASTSGNPGDRARATAGAHEQVGRPGLPRRIVIPALGVRAPVTPIDADHGVLTPPDDPTEAGWWRAGARPGAVRGSAVVTGHTVSTGGGVFDDLEQLRRGDTVTIATTGGDRLSFVVDEVTSYRKQSLPRHAQRLFSQSASGRLVLVTCEDWNGTAYLSNEVVTAVPHPS
jgi:LPXTG-site transpeptidase (sortase) family protein